MFGHRPYVGVSANLVAASQLPGWDELAVTQRALGARPPITDPLPFGRPQLASGPVGSVAKAVVTARSIAVLRHLRGDTRAYIAAATAEHVDAERLTRYRTPASKSASGCCGTGFTRAGFSPRCG